MRVRSPSIENKKAFPGRAKMKQEKFNLNSLELDSVKRLYRKRIDDMLGNTQPDEFQDHYKHIKNSIHQATKEALAVTH